MEGNFIIYKCVFIVSTQLNGSIISSLAIRLHIIHLFSHIKIVNGLYFWQFDLM